MPEQICRINEISYQKKLDQHEKSTDRLSAIFSNLNSLNTNSIESLIEDALLKEKISDCNAFVLFFRHRWKLLGYILILE